MLYGGKMKVGGRDDFDSPIYEVYAYTESYIIYRVDNCIRSYFTNNDPLIVGKHLSFRKHSNSVLSLIEPKVDRYPSICSIVATAMASNYEGDLDEALKLLEIAKNKCITLKTIIGRIYYTYGVFSMVSIFLVLCFISHLFNHNQILKDALNAAFFGSFGAAMSVALSYKDIEVDVDATDLVNFSMGVSRGFIGISAAIFCFLALANDIVFSFAKSHHPWGLWMVAMISGFVEKLAPNIMGSLSERARPPGNLARDHIDAA